MKDFDCSTCNDALKKARHCKFIDSSEWTGKITYQINTARGKFQIDYCLVSFLDECSELQIFVDSYYATEKGLPLFSSLGYLEYPNLIVEAINIIVDEISYQMSKQAEKVS